MYIEREIYTYIHIEREYIYMYVYIYIYMYVCIEAPLSPAPELGDRCLGGGPSIIAIIIAIKAMNITHNIYIYIYVYVYIYICIYIR